MGLNKNVEEDYIVIGNLPKPDGIGEYVGKGSEGIFILGELPEWNVKNKRRKNANK